MTRGGDMKSILQIIPDKIPGSFTVWYWAGGRVQQITITMKRRYYSSRKGGMKKAPREEGEAMQIHADEEVFIKQQDYFQAFIG